MSVKVQKGIPIYIFWKKMNVRQGERGGVYTFFYPKKTQFFGNFMYAKLNNLQFKIAKCMKYFSHSFAVILFFAGLKINNIKKKTINYYDIQNKKHRKWLGKYINQPQAEVNDKKAGNYSFSFYTFQKFQRN